MIGRGWRAAAWAVLCGVLALVAAAQSAPPPGVNVAGAGEAGALPASIGQEVARLNGTLKELVALMRRQLDGQRVELLMRQVELKRSKLAPVEAELRSARSEKEGAEGELRQLQMGQEQIVDEVAANFQGGDGSPEQREQMEKMAEQMSRHYTMQLKLTKERLANLEQKIQLLENDSATARAELEHWETLVARELQR